MRTDGGEVELLADEDRPGGWLLLLDRVRQSYVSLDDPTYLEFPYVQVLAETIDALPPGPLDVVHVGGGGATLPRWIDEVRPGSVQVVFESHAELLRVVQTRLPLPPGSGVDLELADGRDGVAGLPTDSADAVVLDAFSGGRVPAALSTAEFFADVARVLRPAGILLVNTTGAANSLYLRRLVAAVSAWFPEVLVHGDDRGTVGNLVIAAAAAGGLPIETIVAEDGPMGRPIALSGPELAAFLDGAEPLTDASSLRSPTPPDETWRVGSD
ncbi:spermidine synthase [Nakamurella sp. UYEF19]|uniref:spermidine synthase n=1 Tax=Nakamurella sp. UYEF19 TaxID=1756392 RepID=UPI003393564A